MRKFAAFLIMAFASTQNGVANSPRAEGRRSLPETSHVPQLYGFVAAHQIRQLRDLRGGLVARRRERLQRAQHEHAVFVDQRALHLANLGRSEKVETRAAQPAKRAQEEKHGARPATEL